MALAECQICGRTASQTQKILANKSMSPWESDDITLYSFDLMIFTEVCFALVLYLVFAEIIK